MIMTVTPIRSLICGNGIRETLVEYDVIGQAARMPVLLEVLGPEVFVEGGVGAGGGRVGQEAITPTLLVIRTHGRNGGHGEANRSQILPPWASRSPWSPESEQLLYLCIDLFN
jgi:hypothetical protein